MESLNDIARRRLSQHKLGEVSQASLVLFSAGKFLRGHFDADPDAARPLFLKNAVLWIGVKHPVWAQEVQGIIPRLLAALQEQHGRNLIQAIRIKSLTLS